MTSTAARPGRVAKLPPRERILDAAEELFQREGIQRVGVQAVAEKAETTKMAIYRHFETKDALVAEWLRILAAEYQAAFDRVEAEHPGRPREQILGLARFIAEGLPTLSYRGCPFVNSLAELPDRSHPARRVIEEHKARQTRRLVGMCTEAGLPDPEQVAAQITFVLEGAQVSTQNGSIDRAGERLLRIVEAILDQ
ncbi:TetR/AcrR family transcriptional regulator [Streptomyces sp. G3]|uniref:TetR/AcrR family transcriptional regulator n=1 Tax=Streptomyces salinarius TaxID=2762598 RepID=A0ABW8B6W4_9ACTN|nr:MULTISPECIES: TetR/AcrR family transcriptional regulator [Streptomyces]WSU05598.1 TetR/AcrR family transcriptional regulator [Streptomyces sp. NBC_01124]AZM79578.1 TetR/AcrR family transcriptional regulator [Streptomyces sp. KPB2]MBH5134156.1 TetR/AcrR family transcriptional regulator [Streptomyces sp. HB-N217]MCM1940486.1 TetR/AcrR family transcriptional regulator [Streptomyces sp. G3]MCV2461478.1 TetR/AcrR family transcriptional regulator [Streptomyces sp. ICN988]